MRCDACGSETPPLYEHGLFALICHTCKALGRVIEGAFCPDAVEPEMPAPVDQESLKSNTVEPKPNSKKNTTKL